MSCEYQVPKNTLQGQAINFLTKEGKANIGKIFDESSFTLSQKEKFKDSAGLLNMLGKSSELFRQHGLFIHQGDEKIMRRNAKFFENLYDRDRLVKGINTKARTEKGYKHNVISEKRVGENKDYYLLMHGVPFNENRSFEEHEKLKAETIDRNEAYIKVVNAFMKEQIGRDVITLEQSKSGKGIKIVIDDSALQDYNALQYRNYVNSMISYMNDKEDVGDMMIAHPLISELKSDRADARKEKYLLQSRGGKISEINDLDNRINKITDTIDRLEKSEALEDIWEEAEDNLHDIEKLLEKDSMSTQEFLWAKSKLDMWILAGDFQKGTHPFMDEEELGNTFYRETFGKYHTAAMLLMPDLMERGKGLLENRFNTDMNTKKEVEFETIVQLPHKINLWNKAVLSLNRMGQGLAQFIHKTVNEANHKAKIEANIKSRTLAQLFAAVRKSGFDLKSFYQRNAKGERTGKLLGKFSAKYDEEKWFLHNNIKKLRENMIMLDPTILFGKDEAKKKALETTLKEHLGEKEAKKYIDEAWQKYQDYISLKKEFIKQNFDINNLSDQDKRDITNWELENSPIAYMNFLNNTSNRTTEDAKGKATFLVMVPKRFTRQGEETGWYDKNFDAVEANDAAYEFYLEAAEILENASMSFGNASFDTNSLAFIERSITEKYSELGISDFITKEVYDALVRDLTVAEPHDPKTNPLTGKVVKKIRINTQSINQKIENLYKQKLQENGIDEDFASEEEKDHYHSLASDEVFSANSDNLFLSLNLLNLAALSVKHKNNIEDAVNLAMTYLPNSTAKVGDKFYDADGNPIAKEYLDNLMEMVDYFLKMSYYDEGKTDTSATLFRMKTSEEKTKAAAIKKRLQEEDLEDVEKDKLEKELDALGTKVTLNSLAQQGMGILRLKALGWNVPAAITNYLYGKLTNFYKAADGRLFNSGELGRAEKILVTQNKKFNRTVENYGILGDILFEFKEKNRFDEERNWFFKATKSLKPYAMQTITEKHNQGSVMIAMMLHQKVTDLETGEEKSMWEAINDEGELDDKWTMGNYSGEAAVIEMVSRIKSQVEEIHGDYSNPLLIKNSVAGQTLGMFKMWFFEAFHSRFGREREDYIRGLTTRGRYRTLMALIRDYKGNFIKIRSAYKNGTLSEVDAANMRVNIREAMSIIIALGVSAILKGVLCGSDEKCKGANKASLFTLNMIKRLTNEMSFYTSPTQWKNFISNPVASANVLSDMAKAADIIAIQLWGEDKEMVYQQGFRKGRRKDVVLIESYLPGYGQYKRLQHYAGEMLNL